MFKTNKELAAQITKLEAEKKSLEEKASGLQDNADQIAGLEEKIKDLEGSIAEASTEHDEISTQLATANSQLAEKDKQIATLTKERDEAKATTTETIDKQSKDKTIEHLADAGGDVTLTEAGAIEENTANFEAEYEASRKAGGVVHSRFIRDNKAKIREYQEAQASA